MFMLPQKLDATNREVKLYNNDGKLKLRVEFDSITLQPHFFDTDNKPIESPYTIESFYIPNGKHFLNGWMLKSKKIEPKALLLHLHGNAGNLLYQFSAIDDLVEKGFQICIFDYSGFGFSTGKPTQKQVLKDAKCILNFIIKENENTKLPIIIYGQSLGGHLAVELGRLHEMQISGIVIEGAFSSHRDIAYYTMKKTSHLGFLGRLFVSSRYMASTAIKKINKPLLVIHSSEDETIPLYMGKRIFENANEPKEFYLIDGCHICGPSLYADSIATRMKNLFGL